MRIELEWLPLIVGLLVGFSGLALAFYMPARRTNLAVSSMITSLGIGPAVLPGHGELVVAQATRLIFVPHVGAIISGAAFVFVWAAALYVLLSAVRRRKHVAQAG